MAPPGIDPLDPRNLELESRLPGRVVRPLGVDLERPFCLQVLELDRWDDPHAAIDAFRVAKEEEPELQLVLAALLDRAATESWQAAKEVSDYAADVDDVLLLTTYEGLGSLEVGALLLLARAVIERSLREGFELAPFEALWKRTPVVGGLPLTVRDGVDGFLAPEPEQAAARIIELVRDPGLAIEMGRAGPRARARALPRDLGARTRAARPRRYRAGPMKVLLPDGTELQLEDGATGADAARAIGEGLARAALGIRVDGELADLEAPLTTARGSRSSPAATTTASG